MNMEKGRDNFPSGCPALSGLASKIKPAYQRKVAQLQKNAVIFLIKPDIRAYSSIAATTRMTRPLLYLCLLLAWTSCAQSYLSSPEQPHPGAFPYSPYKEIALLSHWSYGIEPDTSLDQLAEPGSLQGEDLASLEKQGWSLRSKLNRHRVNVLRTLLHEQEPPLQEMACQPARFDRVLVMLDDGGKVVGNVFICPLAYNIRSFPALDPENPAPLVWNAENRGHFRKLIEQLTQQR
jgi:hypothetical protein